MKKIIFTLISFVSVVGLQAASLPDNMYFRAMKDEMNRTMKEYRIKKGPKIFYMAYKLRNVKIVGVNADFGKSTPFFQNERLEAVALVDVGTYKNDGLGFTVDREEYATLLLDNISNNYDGIRQALWTLSDRQILDQLKRYEKKRAYKQQKQINQDEYYDFAPVRPNSYVEELKPFNPPSREYLEKLAEKLSAKGEIYPFIESFQVSVSISSRDNFFLNSEGSFYQYNEPYVNISFAGKVRHEKGYVLSFSESIGLVELTSEKEPVLEKKAENFLQKLLVAHKAEVGESYLGPVLLKPEESAFFVYSALGLVNITPLLSNEYDRDYTASPLRDKLGMRVMSPYIEVYDRPFLREYKGSPLLFKPMDDEGVVSQDLLLISNGKLKNLPLSRRSGKRGKTNGHGYMLGKIYPRERTSTLVLEPKEPLSEKELEEKMLERCRELKLEYGYIYHGSKLFERIYVESGKRDFVIGLDMEYLRARSLLDILAGGDDSVASDWVVSPSLLVDEVELNSKEMIPERKPLIPRP